MPKIIALVEDDDTQRDNYTKILQREGYKVQSYSNRNQALAAFQHSLPDMAILDIMLEEELEGGFTLCTQLRQLSPSIPIIFLTARDSDSFRDSGLRLGAWDYLPKNTRNIEYLPIRISSLFRIIESAMTTPKEADTITVGQLTIHKKQHAVHWKNKSLDLTLTEYWILIALTERPGHVKSHEQLMDAANTKISNNAIATYIRRIRDKFQEIDTEFNAIRTEYGMGYRWRID